MTRWLLAILLSLAATLAARADEPAPAANATACAVPNEQVTGPRAPDRPLPLLSGDPAHGFRPACSVPWSALSPNKQALPVLSCFQGSLLQLPASAVCGRVSGPLWVSSRWVTTNADAPPGRAAEPSRTTGKATCEQLQTGAYAATRDYPYSCVPAQRDLPAKPPAAAQPKASADSAPATAPVLGH